MQRLEVSDAVRPIYGSLGVKRLITKMRHDKVNGRISRFCERAYTEYDDVHQEL